MIDAIAGGLGGVKAALDTISGLNATITEAKVAEAKVQIIASLIEAQRGLLDAQRLLTEDTETISALEAEVRHLKDWSAEAERYELADAGQGCLAYRMKDAESAASPTHWLCPNCYAQHKKAILQPERLPMRSEGLSCHSCGLLLVTMGQVDRGGRR